MIAAGKPESAVYVMQQEPEGPPPAEPAAAAAAGDDAAGAAGGNAAAHNGIAAVANGMPGLVVAAAAVAGAVHMDVEAAAGAEDELDDAARDPHDTQAFQE